MPAGGELHFHLLKGGNAKQIVGTGLGIPFSLGVGAGTVAFLGGPDVDECTRKACARDARIFEIIADLAGCQNHRTPGEPEEQVGGGLNQSWAKCSGSRIPLRSSMPRKARRFASSSSVEMANALDEVFVPMA